MSITRFVLAFGMAVLLAVSTVLPSSAALWYNPDTNKFEERSASGRTGSSSIRKQVVDYETNHKPGTIVIETSERRLYLVLEDGKAMKYGIGVGRDGFRWAGTHRITRKAEWPGWTPPPEMRKRQPWLPTHMEGGPANPLGARALYIGTTVYRIHGTNAPQTIGHAVSSGCFRLVNDDIIDLYERVPVGTKIVVLHN